MAVKGKVNAGVFIEFLKRLVHNTDRTIFLIVDGHPSHKAQKVKQYVGSLDGWLELFFLPPYSPTRRQVITVSVSQPPEPFFLSSV